MIKAVLFDVDGVLLDSFEASLKFYQDLMAKAGYRPPTRDEFRKFFHLPLVEGIRLCAPSASEEEVTAMWEMGRRREVPFHAELAAIPEGADGILNKLSQSYRLGVVTSRVKTTVFETPELEKLKRYFQVAVSYEDTEKHKPDPEPLLFALGKLEVAPRNAVYIGDVETDLMAARGAGTKAIIYSPEKIEGADAWTSSFGKIPELIETL